MATRRKKEGVTGRTNDPDRTKANILDVAIEHFAEHGLSGARIDEIAETTSTSKRMIYYYFGNKEGLYEAVLKHSYLAMRRMELEVDIEATDPMEALRKIVEFTIDHQHRHPSFGRLVAIENIHRGRHIRGIPGMREHNAVIIVQLGRLLARGADLGLFRSGLNAIDLHWMISAFAIFNVVNDHTFAYLYPRGGTEQDVQTARRQAAVEAVTRWCAKLAPGDA